MNILKKVKIRIVNKLPYFCYKSKFLTSLYYFLIDKSFSRELQSVLAGKVKHIVEAKEIKANYFLLVRNTHRMEKGLLMKPRKIIFGKDYLEETIDSFEGIYNLSTENEVNKQIKWFHDVIAEYFEVVDSRDPIIAKAKSRFEAVILKRGSIISLEESKSKPYIRSCENFSNIDYEQFYKLCKQRRSVRWFLDKKVPREIIDRGIQAANQSPSACNRQPFVFRVFDNPELVKEVIDIPMGTKGYGHTVPVLIVLVGNLDAYFDERDRHIIYIDASLAAMSFMLALETMGLSTVSINWPDIEAREKRMEKFLKLENYQRPLMCIGLGYPDPEGLVAFSEKRPLNQIRRYN